MNRKLLLIISGSTSLVLIGLMVYHYYPQETQLKLSKQPAVTSTMNNKISPQYTYEPKNPKLEYPQLSGQNPPTDEDMRKWKAYTDELSKRLGPDWVAPLTPIPPAPTLEAYPSTTQ